MHVGDVIECTAYNDKRDNLWPGGWTTQKKTVEEAITCYLRGLITLRLAFAFHGTNRSVRECIKRCLPQLSDYPYTSKELRTIAEAFTPAYEVEHRWRRLEEEQGGTIQFVSD